MMLGSDGATLTQPMEPVPMSFRWTPRAEELLQEIHDLLAWHFRDDPIVRRSEPVTGDAVREDPQ